MNKKKCSIHYMRFFPVTKVEEYYCKCYYAEILKYFNVAIYWNKKFAGHRSNRPIRPIDKDICKDDDGREKMVWKLYLLGHHHINELYSYIHFKKTLQTANKQGIKEKEIDG